MAEQMLVAEESNSSGSEKRTMKSSDVEEEIFEVDKIIGKTLIKGTTMFKVRWKGYGTADDTWEPRHNLATCNDLIDEYLHKQSELALKKNEEKKKVQTKPPLLSSSEDDSASTFKNSFYDDLEAGRINLFASDMYSKVKGRACRPSCLKDTTDSDMSSANEKKEGKKKRTLSNPEKGSEKTKCPPKNMKSKSTSKVKKKHVSKINSDKHCSQKLDFKLDEITETTNVDRPINKDVNIVHFTSDSDADSDDSLPSLLDAVKDKHEKMSVMSECSTATINYSLMDDDNAENSCHGIPAANMSESANSAAKCSMVHGSGMHVVTNEITVSKTASHKLDKNASAGLLVSGTKQLISHSLSDHKSVENKQILDHNSNVTMTAVSEDVNGQKLLEGDDHKSSEKRKHQHKHSTDKSHQSSSSGHTSTSHVGSSDSRKARHTSDTHHRSSHKDDHGHRHRHRSKEKKARSGKRKSSSASLGGSTDMIAESEDSYGKMPKLVPEVPATTECQLSRLSLENKRKYESNTHCDIDNENGKQKNERPALGTNETGMHLGFQKHVNTPESFHSKSKHLSADHKLLGNRGPCKQSAVVVKPEMDSLRDCGIAPQSMEDVLRKSGLQTLPTIKHETVSDPLGIELDDADWQLFEQEVRLEPITITDQEFAKAVATGDYELVKRAFKGDGKYNLENADSTGKTLIMIAVEKVYDDIADLLLEHGALINAQANDGTTALMLACKHAETSTVNLLLELGAKVNLEQSTKDTALIKAAERGHKQMLWLLLECGANFNHANETGYTALSYCKILHDVDTETIVTGHISRVQREFDEQVSVTLNKTASTMNCLFPTQVYNVSDGEKFQLEFDHKLQSPVPGVGYLLFIAHAMFTNGDVKCRFYGPCAVKSVLLNGHLQSSLTEEANFVLAFSPLANGTNVLTIHTVRAPDVKAKMIVCAYKAQLLQ